MIESRFGAVMVRMVDPVIEPDVAEIVVEPWATAVAKPEAAIVALEVVVELQVTVAERSCVDPLL